MRLDFGHHFFSGKLVFIYLSVVEFGPVHLRVGDVLDWAGFGCGGVTCAFYFRMVVGNDLRSNMSVIIVGHSNQWIPTHWIRHPRLQKMIIYPWRAFLTSDRIFINEFIAIARRLKIDIAFLFHGLNHRCHQIVRLLCWSINISIQN